MSSFADESLYHDGIYGNSLLDKEQNVESGYYNG